MYLIYAICSDLALLKFFNLALTFVQYEKLTIYTIKLIVVFVEADDLVLFLNQRLLF